MAQVFVYAFCEGCGTEVDSSSYPEKSSLCKPCEEELEAGVKLNTSLSHYLALSPQTSNNMSATLNITPEQIKAHRASRKAAGLVGCKDGSDAPSNSLSGISWRPANPMNPSCFCHDCRDTWDSDASVDLQLLKDGHEKAMWTYTSLLPVLPKRSNGGGIEMSHDGLPPTRTMTEHPEAYARGVPREVFFPPPIQTSLPRDVLNEMPNERLKNDLAELRGNIQRELVRVMDKKRSAAYRDEPQRSEFLHCVNEEEGTLWKKLDAVELLLKD